MKARHASHRAGVTAALAVLLLQAACEADASSGSSGASADAAATADTTVRVTNPWEAGDLGAASCPSETLHSWSLGDITTRRLGA